MARAFIIVILALEIFLYFLGGWSAAVGALAGALIAVIPFIVITEWISMRRYHLTSREIFNDWLEILHLTRRH